ncbi:uncharacterized protein si:dkeyp-72g9.4 [Nerophis ophidion]|uniref:uncharacterized protein si:dkeyp-72g9.4 n=1 Tax=Nerophis ophidion TaxID=159077 RepID=UPI002AE0917A|nr:uncharacterized protein si:dkeyp-72g9.4 [Nerophis ophidion]
MRLRSKLLSKGGLLLPTIRECTEETLRELNETNAVDQVSSDDYLLSICHLAHPTFPTTHVPPRHQRSHNLSRLSGTKSFEWMQRREHNGADPLEYLYGRHDNRTGSGAESCQRQRDVERERPRARSIPHTASPGLPRQRTSSCPELQTDFNLGTLPNISPEHNRPGLGSVSDDKGGLSPAKRPSGISQWISDCSCVQGPTASLGERTRITMRPTRYSRGREPMALEPDVALLMTASGSRINLS